LDKNNNGHQGPLLLAFFARGIFLSYLDHSHDALLHCGVQLPPLWLLLATIITTFECYQVLLQFERRGVANANVNTICKMMLQ